MSARQRRHSGTRSMPRQRERGQAIVVMTLALAAMLAATAMVVDGGNAMNQHRNTQDADGRRRGQRDGGGD
jgi:Flp pilus assembly protein TadG